MALALTIVSEPAIEPVSLESTEDHLRLSETSTGEEDTVILGFITAARRYCEGFQNRAYIHQTLKLTLDEWPDEDWIEIPRPPLVSVSSVVYYSTGGSASTLSAGTYYVDVANEPGRVHLQYGEVWPSDTLRPANGIEVTFLCGYGSAASSVPQEVKQAIMNLVGHMYEHREGSDIKEIVEVPLALHGLLWPERIVPI